MSEMYIRKRVEGIHIVTQLILNMIHSIPQVLNISLYLRKELFHIVL